EQLGNVRSDIRLPVVALVDLFVQPLAFCLAVEPTDPHERIGILFAHEAGDDLHAFGRLKRKDLSLEELHPLVALARACVVLPELEEHAPLYQAPRAAWRLLAARAVQDTRDTTGWEHVHAVGAEEIHRLRGLCPA